MKFRKIMIILVLAIFIFSVASVCASDMDDAVIASEDNGAIKLSQADTYDEISAIENEEIATKEMLEHFLNCRAILLQQQMVPY